MHAVRSYSPHALTATRSTMSHIQARAALLKSMEQSLGMYLGLYKELLSDCKDSHTVTQLCHYLILMTGVGREAGMHGLQLSCRQEDIPGYTRSA